MHLSLLLGIALIIVGACFLLMSTLRTDARLTNAEILRHGVDFENVEPEGTHRVDRWIALLCAVIGIGLICYAKFNH